MKKVINKEKEEVSGEGKQDDMVNEAFVGGIDPQDPYYAMVLINSYLQFLYVFERVSTNEKESDLLTMTLPDCIEVLAIIVKAFEETYRLEVEQIDALDGTVELIEGELEAYFSFKEKVDSLSEKVKVLAPMAYGEKHQVDGLVKSGELFNPESRDRYLQSIPKLTERINLVNKAMHTIDIEAPLEGDVAEEVNQWFKRTEHFKNVAEADLAQVKEILNDVKQIS